MELGFENVVQSEVVHFLNWKVVHCYWQADNGCCTSLLARANAIQRYFRCAAAGSVCEYLPITMNGHLISWTNNDALCDTFKPYLELLIQFSAQYLCVMLWRIIMVSEVIAWERLVDDKISRIRLSRKRENCSKSHASIDARRKQCTH